MIQERRHTVLLAAIAILFAMGLTWAAMDLPRVINSALQAGLHSPDFQPGGMPPGQSHWLTPVRVAGYASMTLVTLAMVAGLVLEKRRLAAAGALAFFLPVFGHYAVGMLFLAGLGVLRVEWLPLVDVSTDLLRLGEIAWAPYMAVVYPAALVGADVRELVVWVLMGGGMLIFVLATMEWFRVRIQDGAVDGSSPARSSADGRSQTALARRGVYRISRHPQYLGWIVWSYGMMVFLMLHSNMGNTRVAWGMPNSLPWLVATLVIIGVALLEEIAMRRAWGEQYDAYRRKTPFLLPLPRPLQWLAAAPYRMTLRLMGVERPRTGRQVAVVVAVYLALLVAASAPFVILDWPPGAGYAGSRMGWWTFPYNVWPFQ